MSIDDYAERISSEAGAARAGERLNPDGVGTRRRYANGHIYEHRRRGVLGFVPRGAVRQIWRRNEYEHGFLGYPTSASRADFDEDNVPFEGGSIRVLDRDRPAVGMSFLNTQLIVDVGPFARPYRGRGRDRQTARVIEVVRENASAIDIVGLAELFADDERERIARELRSIYPYQLSGPDESDLDQDGGLLLLSKHPFADQNQLIYRVSARPDSFANKGILHARILIDGERGRGNEIDVYLSHLQAGGEAVKAHQARMIASYVAAISGRQVPAVVLADYNLDFNSAQRNRYLDQLGHPFDSWAEFDWYRGNLGITSDRRNCYVEGALPIRSEDRGVDGRRIDAAMIYPGDNVALEASFMHVDRPELIEDSGIDLSDHYGIRLKVKPVPVAVRFDRRVTAATLSVARVHCLDTTSGPGDDEVYLNFWGGADDRRLIGNIRVNIGDMSDGETRILGSTAPSIRVQGAGRQLDRLSARARVKEDDGIFRDDLIGDTAIELTAEQLLLSAVPNRRHEFALPLMTGDGGRYVVHMSYELETASR